jgi:hypothetical protein
MTHLFKIELLLKIVVPTLSQCWNLHFPQVTICKYFFKCTTWVSVLFCNKKRRGTNGPYWITPQEVVRTLSQVWNSHWAQVTMQTYYFKCTSWVSVLFCNKRRKRPVGSNWTASKGCSHFEWVLGFSLSASRHVTILLQRGVLSEGNKLSYGKRRRWSIGWTISQATRLFPHFESVFRFMLGTSHHANVLL